MKDSRSVAKRVRTITIQVMTTALWVAAFVVFISMIERLQAVDEVRTTSRIQQEIDRMAGRLLLIDERLTTAIRMASVTGDSAWIETYRQHRLAMDEAIAEAVEKASPHIARNFTETAKRANDELASRDQRVLDAVGAGDFEAAAASLDSTDRMSFKTKLAGGIYQFQSDWTAEREVAITEGAWRRALIGGGLGLAGMAAILGFGWWRLKRDAKFLLAADEEMRSLALMDADTGLPNRHAMLARLDAAFAEKAREHGPFDLVTVNIADLSVFDDAIGHGHSDRAIHVLAEDVRACAEDLAICIEGNLVARTGTGEISFIVPRNDRWDRANCDQLSALSQRMQGRPITVAGVAFSCRRQIGFASFPEHGQKGEELLSASVLASHSVEDCEDGLARPVRFDESLRNKAAAEARLRDELRQAVASHSVRPYFQPVVDIGTGQLVGLEALARWQRNNGEFVPPDQFIPMAEDLGLIAELTRSILAASLNALSQLPDYVWIAVNVSPALFQSTDFASEIVERMSALSIESNRLEIEVTETALLVNAGPAARAMQTLRAAGIGVALDDFGTGYSSLSYLSHFPIDKIKLDRSFLSRITEDERSKIIVRRIVAMGNELGLTITAEGVETEDQAQLLKSWRCLLAQGYLYSPPKPLEAILSDWCGSQMEIETFADL